MFSEFAVVLVVILSVLFLLGLLELAYYLAAFALCWAPALLLGLFAMQTAQALGLDDPLAPLWGFMAGALLGRVLLGMLHARPTHRG